MINDPVPSSAFPKLRYDGSAEFRHDVGTAMFTARLTLAERQLGPSKEVGLVGFGEGWS